MATITQLYTAIILDLNRDDMGSGGALEQAKIDAVSRAIEMYADQQFWFNRKSGTVTTTGSSATSALPSGMRYPTIVSYLGTPLRKVPLDAIEEYYNGSSPMTGIPTYWAEDTGTLHFFPTPDAGYLLSVYGLADLGVPGTSNAWTVEGYWLILAESKRILYRGTLRDPDGLALAQDEVNEALLKLRQEAKLRRRSLLSSDVPQSRRGFNINTGDYR